MRLQPGAPLLVFDGRNGEWRAEVAEAGKRGGMIEVMAQTRPQIEPPDLWLLFAPVKKTRTDFIVEKAVEMGAARIVPVQTDYTNAGRIQRDRLQANAVEAAEQCGATYVPVVAEMTRLGRLLDEWPEERRLMFCDEAAAGTALHFGAENGQPVPWAILIGPEGGFSPAERDRLESHPAATRVSLGPRILRAETAAVAALTLWQSSFGDWR